MLATLWLIGCNPSAETETNGDAASAAVESEEQTDMAAYDPTMDLALTGGDSIQILGDTLGIKMYIASMAPGDSVAWHYHPDHTIYVLEGRNTGCLFRRSRKANYGTA